MRDLATTVETIVDENATGLHILDMNLALEPEDDDPYQRDFLNSMGTIAQLEADMIRERTRSGIEAAKTAGKHTGQPPFGFDVNDGYLTPNGAYDMAVEILERIEKSESKRSVARFAGVSRSTVGRILDRADPPPFPGPCRSVPALTNGLPNLVQQRLCTRAVCCTRQNGPLIVP